ncbi:MAG: single-stranded-DNA-specific exonuclease RecJ [Pseudomonadota bacterium]
MLDRTAFLGVAHSVTGRRWVGASVETERLGLAIAQTADLPEIVGRVLATRGVLPEEADAYLAPTLRDLMPDPSTLPDMDAAAERLAKAVMRRERVALFGDYDVDGAASVALLCDWLAAFGITATVHIPDRIEEGYGPNRPAMARLGAAHDLVICLDCGSTSPDPVAAAVEGGAEVLIVDHHLAEGPVPSAMATVNPNRSDCDSDQGALCAAGVAFLLLVATNRHLRLQGAFTARPEPKLLDVLDLVALATIADVAPLTGLNRAFVRQGLTVLARRGRPGLAALSDVAGLSAPPTARDLGFALGPRINAGGRIGEAGLGLRLLCAPDAATAEALAGRLDALNRERREIEAAVLAAAEAQIEGRDKPGALVWAAGAGWHPGVVGIVASRLKERHNRPAIVIGLDGEEGKGSGRSVPGVDLGTSVAALAAEGLLLRGGGHAMAAGLSVASENVEPAMAALERLLARQGAGAAGPRDLAIDGLLTPEAASRSLIETLEQAGPFGQASPAPRFAFASVRVKGMRRVGQGHLAFRVGTLEAIAFRAEETGLASVLSAAGETGSALHLAGRLEIDDWGGRRRVKLRLEDAAQP